MARRISTSQFRSMLRQIEQKNREAVRKYNESVRKYNESARRYNQRVRDYQARVRSYGQRIRSELARLSQGTSRTKYTVVHTSVTMTYHAYVRLEERATSHTFGPSHNEIMWLSERETANSLRVRNALDGQEPDPEDAMEDPQTEELVRELDGIGPDLGSRWRGAVMSLRSNNPDSHRHFCVSARETISQVLEITAPDSAVLAVMPACDRTPQGKPTRRSKIGYLLHKKGISDNALEDFTDRDIEDIVQLVRELDAGTHGSVGRFTAYQLAAITQRVTHGLDFLTWLAI